MHALSAESIIAIMSTIDELFKKLRSEKRKALMPFVTVGDPDLDFTAAVVQEFAKRDCAMCEVGIPYSDPIADGQPDHNAGMDHSIRPLAANLPLVATQSAALSFVSLVVISSAIGAALGSRYRQHTIITVIAGFFLGAICGYMLFLAIFFLTPWWPFSDGP